MKHLMSSSKSGAKFNSDFRLGASQNYAADIRELEPR